MASDRPLDEGVPAATEKRAPRHPLSKKLRFEIFKRDGFRCVYCGSGPEASPLHVDHVDPVCEGGGDEPENLVTSCQPCNGGKGRTKLERLALPAPDPEAAEHAREHAEQIRGYIEAQRALRDARDELVGRLRERWELHFDDGNTPREVTMFENWLEQWPLAPLERAIDLACSKFPGRRRNAIMYLCGIIRRWRERGEVTV